MPPSIHSVARAAAHPVQWYRRRNIKHTPKNIFMFLTDTCNLHCEHCFYHFELNKKAAEISLEQIEKVARSLTQPTFFCLTGGEVTLRKDLPDAALLLADSGKVDFINVCTNGFYPDRIEALVEKTLGSGRLKRIGFQISLDGLEEMHNAVRKHPAAYRTAMESLKLLKKLQAKYPDRLEYTALAVITRHNFDQMIDLLHATQHDDIPFGFSIVRASNDVFNLNLTAASGFDVKDQDATLGVSVEEWRRKVDEIYEVKREWGYEYPIDQNRRIANVVIDTLEFKRRMIPCDAGSLDGVIYPNGTVAHCENTRPFANLSEFDFDLQALWHSDAANAMRKKITTCACTHACNIVDSLAARPQLYPLSELESQHTVRSVA
jgi:MoaA/NifB/PqqE/SkfB family radical SAM enzyme